MTKILLYIVESAKDMKYEYLKTRYLTYLFSLKHFAWLISSWEGTFNKTSLIQGYIRNSGKTSFVFPGFPGNRAIHLFKQLL